MKNLFKKIVGTEYEWESHIANIFYLFKKCLKEYKPEIILDVGCGDGQRTTRIANYFNIKMSNIYGVDYDDKCVIEASKIFNAKKIDLETEVLPYRDGMFDLVICNQVLEHLKNFKETIEDIIRVTSKGGYIIIGIPNLAHLINRIYLLLGIQPMCIHLDGPHVRSYTHRAFIHFLRSLENIKLIGYTGALMYPLPIGISKILAKFFIGLSGYTCYLLEKTN